MKFLVKVCFFFGDLFTVSSFDARELFDCDSKTEEKVGHYDYDEWLDNVWVESFLRLLFFLLLFRIFSITFFLTWFTGCVSDLPQLYLLIRFSNFDSESSNSLSFMSSVINDSHWSFFALTKTLRTEAIKFIHSVNLLLSIWIFWKVNF